MRGNRKKLKEIIDSKMLLVFDFDGVIADSNEIKTEAFAELYEPFGKEVVAKVVAYHRQNGGVSRFDKIRFFHKVFIGKEINETEVNQFADYFSGIVKDRVIKANEIRGVGRFLKHYCMMKRKCIINSATPEVEIKEIINLRKQAHYFSCILGSPNTKYNNLMKVIDVFKVERKDVVFFGDAITDFQAANEAEIDFICVNGDQAMRKLKEVTHIKDFDCFDI